MSGQVELDHGPRRSSASAPTASRPAGALGPAAPSLLPERYVDGRSPRRARSRCCCRRCRGIERRRAGSTAWCCPAAATSTRPGTAPTRDPHCGPAAPTGTAPSWRWPRAALDRRPAGARHLPRAAGPERRAGRHAAPAPARRWSATRPRPRPGGYGAHEVRRAGQPAGLDPEPHRPDRSPAGGRADPPPPGASTGSAPGWPRPRGPRTASSRRPSWTRPGTRSRWRCSGIRRRART